MKTTHCARVLGSLVLLLSHHSLVFGGEDLHDEVLYFHMDGAQNLETSSQTSPPNLIESGAGTEGVEGQSWESPCGFDDPDSGSLIESGAGAEGICFTVTDTPE